MVERQLDLLKTKRQKGTLPKGPSEFEIHCMVADYLRNGLAPGWMWFHCPNGELRNKATGGRLKRMGVVPGVSDILLACAPNATLHALELKRRGEKLREDQRLWMEQVLFLGGKAAWAANVDDAIEILTGWGAISTRIHLSGG